MRHSLSLQGQQLRDLKIEADQIAAELRATLKKIGAGLDEVRAAEGEIGFHDFLVAEFAAPPEDVSLYLAHARSSDEEMAAILAKGRAVTAECVPAPRAVPGSLGELANAANRMDALAVERLKQSGEARQAVGTILTEAAGRFDSVEKFHRWLDEHFLSGTERAKAFITLASHEVPAVTSFDLWSFENRLGEEIEKLRRSAKDQPPPLDDPVKGKALDATVFRAHWSIAMQAIGTSHESIRIAAETARQAKADLGAEGFVRWANLTGQTLEQIEGIMDASRPGESLADMIARADGPNKPDA